MDGGGCEINGKIVFHIIVYRCRPWNLKCNANIFGLCVQCVKPKNAENE